MTILVHSLALIATLLALGYLGLLARGTYRRQERIAQLYKA